jgi:hypothetical protein
LDHRDRAAGAIEQDRPGTGGSLIKRQDVFHSGWSSSNGLFETLDHRLNGPDLHAAAERVIAS